MLIPAFEKSLKRSFAALALAAWLLGAGCSAASTPDVVALVPDLETEPVPSRGDAADDAVVVTNGQRLRILGTDKQAGLAVYDLRGVELAFLPVGALNNVDAVRLAPDRFLAAASNRSDRSIDLFHVDLARDSVTRARQIPLSLRVPYGLCMGDLDAVTVFVGDKSGRLEQWALADDLSAERVGAFRFDSLTEGCVFDAADGMLYVGEERRGIWALNVASGARQLIDSTRGDWLTADVEGLDIFDAGQAGRFLLASSQGDSTFVVYALPEGVPVARFRIRANRDLGVDGVTDTDGVAVSELAAPAFPRGILVVQDGNNRKPVARQNFKVIDWRRVEALLEFRE